MNVRKRIYTAIIIVITLSLLVVLFKPSNKSNSNTVKALEDFEAITQSLTGNSYDDYLMRYDQAERPSETIRIEGEAFTEVDGGTFEVVNNFAGLDGQSVITSEIGTIHWDVHIEKAGLYNMRIHYYPIEGKSASIERELKINDEVPFLGAGMLIFDRLWTNRDGEIKRDDRGNDLRPRQVEKPSWQVAMLNDAEGYYEEPYLFYYEQGMQRISLTALREPMVIDYIELMQVQDDKPYAEVAKQYEALNLPHAHDQFIMIQAEQASLKSSPTLYPLSDRSSPTLIPYDVSKLRINTIGALNWNLPGHWIQWEFEVEEDGLYQIALKRKQDQLRGLFATRSIMIDGQIPFEEMKRVRFNHNADWVMDVLGEDEEPYLFYLTKGTHELRMTVTLGEIAPLLRTIESSVLTLNDMYRNILMITSNNPDPFRDYQLENRIPDMITVFEEQADTIEAVADYLEEVTGERSDKVAILTTLVHQLRDMAARPETVAKRLDTFKINVGGLGTWILTVREQPLSLDYLVISSPGHELPRAEATWFEKTKHEFGAYFASYTEDYDSIGNVEEMEESITVWITTGRDQAQVLKGLIDDRFTPETNISVQLRLVPPNILLPATLAGEGPDVAMQMGEDVPVNYAMRSAAADLSTFSDFEHISKRFRASALLPYEYNGGYYALPEQQTFPMLFYRKDILEELELSPPKTWEDVYDMISVLHKNNLDFYLPLADTLNNANLIPNDTFAMLLYQNGGEFYSDDYTESALDSEISMQVFNRWTQFYTNYKFPLMADFPNRFRTGEMPIGIADYTTYNLLTVLAPEIRNLWEFTTIPGTVLPDGSLRHDVASATTAVVMLENSNNKEAAWEFMKWWTDADIQVEYGREMEGLMGAAARYPTANIEALEQLPWPQKDYKNLEAQWQWVRGIPQVPGGYFTGRHLDNAFRKVVNGNENPREALNDYIVYINDEIQIKRQEFNLPY